MASEHARLTRIDEALDAAYKRGLEADRLAAYELGRSEQAGALMNLLAVIHRDGGHYVSNHGFVRAGEDAEALVLSERAELDRLRGQVEALQSDMQALRSELWTARALLAGPSTKERAAAAEAERVALLAGQEAGRE